MTTVPNSPLVLLAILWASYAVFLVTVGLMQTVLELLENLLVGLVPTSVLSVPWTFIAHLKLVKFAIHMLKDVYNVMWTMIVLISPLLATPQDIFVLLVSPMMTVLLTLLLRATLLLTFAVPVWLTNIALQTSLLVTVRPTLALLACLTGIVPLLLNPSVMAVPVFNVIPMLTASIILPNDSATLFITPASPVLLTNIAKLPPTDFRNLLCLLVILPPKNVWSVLLMLTVSSHLALLKKLATLLPVLALNAQTLFIAPLVVAILALWLVSNVPLTRSVLLHFLLAILAQENASNVTLMLTVPTHKYPLVM
jgi:hypothetical protein